MRRVGEWLSAASSSGSLHPTNIVDMPPIKTNNKRACNGNFANLPTSCLPEFSPHEHLLCRPSRHSSLHQQFVPSLLPPSFLPNRPNIPKWEDQGGYPLVALPPVGRWGSAARLLHIINKQSEGPPAGCAARPSNPGVQSSLLPPQNSHSSAPARFSIRSELFLGLGRS